MDEREFVRELRVASGAVRRSASPRKSRCWLERIATGTALWCLPAKLLESRFKRSIQTCGEESDNTEHAFDRWLTYSLACRYGRHISSELKHALDQHREAGYSERDLHLLVVNRILRNDGRWHISMWKEWSLLMLGLFFVALCLISLLLTLGLIWLSPATISLKFLATCLPIAIFFSCGYSFSCFSIKPFLLVQKISRGPRLSIV